MIIIQIWAIWSIMADRHSYWCQSNHSWLSATQMPIIQIQPHSPQNTNTHEKCWKKRYILSKKPIAKFRPHQMTGASQPSRESARIQKQFSVFFFHFFWNGLILCVTLYVTKPCGFLQPQFTVHSFLSASYSIIDTNNNSPWRKSLSLDLHIVWYWKMEQSQL